MNKGNEKFSIKIVTIVFLVLIAGFGFISVSHAALTDGLVAYYQFEGNANDASGNGHNGTEHGVNYVEGKMGLAGEFIRNQQDYISVAHHTDLQPALGESMTVSVWFKSHGPVLLDGSIVDKTSQCFRNGWDIIGKKGDALNILT